MNIILAPARLLVVIAQSAFLALGQIRANKMRSFLTTLGIVIGVASVTAVIAGLAGLKAKVLSDFQTMGTNSIFIWPNRPDTGPMKWATRERIALRPEQVDGMLAACPCVDAYMRVCPVGGTVRYGQWALEEADIAGVDPSAFKVANRPIILGRAFTALDESQRRQACVVTPDARDRLHLDRDCIGQSIRIDARSFTVVGVVSPPQEMALGGQNGASLGVYIPFSTAYNRNAQGTSISVQALAKSSEVAEEARAQITAFLRRTRHIKPDEPDTFNVETMQSNLEDFNRIALAVTAVAAGVVGISLLVGGVGIMNTMLVSVGERTREIGLRKAIGARSSAVLLQFLVEAVTLCLAGGLLGLAGGWLLTKAIGHIPNAQLDAAYIPFWAVQLSFGFATAVGLIFGMFPAVKAARLDPIEALRHE